MNHDQLPPLLLVDHGASTRDGRALFYLFQPFQYRVGFDGGGLEVRVPAGFVTNFASVPRWLWSVFPPDGPWRKAAVVHDYAYTREAGIPRFLADAIFRDCMHRAGVPALARLAIYYGVRLFGGWSYRLR